MIVGKDRVLAWVVTEFSGDCWLNDLREYAKENKMGSRTLYTQLRKLEEDDYLKKSIVDTQKGPRIKYAVTSKISNEWLSKLGVNDLQLEEKSIEETIDDWLLNVKVDFLFTLDAYVNDKGFREQLNNFLVKDGSYALPCYMIYKGIEKGEYTENEIRNLIAKKLKELERK